MYPHHMAKFIGHILGVAIAIAVNGFVIPPRIGLSMELSVGLMLMVLGVMNLSVILAGRSLTCWFSA